MRFRLQTDYALKALLYLATSRGANSTTEEIAALYQISAAHLGRVIRRLQRYGYVKAIRGRRGGVRLDCDPTAISLGDLVDILEEGGGILELPTRHGEGAEAQAAQMKAALRRAQGLFLNYLRQVTLADVVAAAGEQPDRGRVEAPAAERERVARPGRLLEPVGAMSQSPGFPAT